MNMDAQPDDEDERTEDGKLWRRCVDCTSPFFITPAAQQGFALKGFPLTRRCWSCRQKRKLAKEIKHFELGG
jgi:hypothetical protein